MSGPTIAEIVRSTLEQNDARNLLDPDDAYLLDRLRAGEELREAMRQTIERHELGHDASHDRHRPARADDRKL